MSTIDDLLKKHRKRIIDREAATFRELLLVYRDLQKDLKSQFQAIQKMITDARAAGEEISPSWFRRSSRLQSMLGQVQEQIVRFGGKVTTVVSREQTAAISIATEHTRDVVRAVSSESLAGLGSLLPTRAIEHAVGMMGDGSPMITYFAKTFAPNVADVLGKEILKAVALGTDFNTVARRLMAAGDITRQRALTMARTEVNRVRRATTQRIYQEHADVFTGWEWVAAKSERTCVVCLALDGTVYDLDVPFPQHINCRCTLIPVIKGVERPKRELGAEWFDRQSDEVKEKIIGKDGLAAYKDGIVTLKDFVGYATSKEFGKRVYTRPLIQILAGKPVTELVIRTPKDITTTFGPGVNDRIEEILGRRLDADQIGGLVGALDGSRISAITEGDDVYFEVSHPLVAVQQRSLGLDDWDRPWMYNNHFRKSRTAPPSIGLKAFATQVLHAEQYGVEYIRTYAAGNYESSQKPGGYIGYMIWPRYGYNAQLTDEDRLKFPKTFRTVRDLNDLHLQVNGKFVWLYKGTAREMVFDVGEDERSWEILQKRLQKEGFEIRLR